MSIARDPSSAARSKSSSVRTTYFPLAYSYPLTTSLQGTGCPSSAHTRSYLTGERSSAWSIRNEMRSPRTAVRSSTGMLTSPKVIAPFQIAAMACSPRWGSEIGRERGQERGHLWKRTFVTWAARAGARSVKRKRPGTIPGHRSAVEKERPGQPSPGLSIIGRRPKVGSGLRDVRCLRSFLSLDDLKFDAIALGERLEAVGLDRAEVDEDVGASLARDESVALCIVEPLHGAGDACHGALPLPPRGLTVVRWCVITLDVPAGLSRVT